jgi:hypothetical protein
MASPNDHDDNIRAMVNKDGLTHSQVPNPLQVHCGLKRGASERSVHMETRLGANILYISLSSRFWY